MLMGYPMNITRYTDEAYLFFNYKLKLELHLINQLKKTRYHILYKVHPDRFFEIGNIYKNENIEIVKEKFENIWHHAEVLIFTYTSSTTFGFALDCPVPIILIESEGTPWIKGRRNVLKRRAAILTLSNNNNYNTISDTKLKLAIKEAKKKANLYKTKRLIGNF